MHGHFQSISLCYIVWQATPMNMSCIATMFIPHINSTGSKSSVMSERIILKRYELGDWES
jgi:hypothetical protein